MLKIGCHDNVPNLGLICEQIPTIWWKIVKIGPVDPEIIGLKEIIKNINKRKLMQAKHTASSALKVTEFIISVAVV